MNFVLFKMIFFLFKLNKTGNLMQILMDQVLEFSNNTNSTIKEKFNLKKKRSTRTKQKYSQFKHTSHLV